MNKVQAYEIIRARWGAQWPGLSGSVSYVFDNEAAPDTPTYARFSILGGRSERATVGPSPFKKTRYGTIEVKLVGPANAGRTPLDTLAQHIKTIFEEQRLSFVPGDDIVCLETSDREGNNAKEPQRWILIVSTPFWFSEAG